MVSSRSVSRTLGLLFILFVVGLCLPWGCAADDLEGYLAAGACTADHKCAPGYVCDTSQSPPQCLKGSLDGSIDPCAQCSGNEICCTDECADTTTNSNHCGGCDKPCPGTSCESSACTTTCILPFLDCDGNKITNGCETNAATDPQNCGACNTPCSTPTGGTAVCDQGSCGSSCPTDTELCDVACIATASDPDNCGGCAVQCPGVSHGSRACATGTCGQTCDSGFTDCGGDGCLNTQTDAFNCGNCGNACDTGQVCYKGGCAAGCSELTQCGSSCVSTATDTMHCGGCGQACPEPEHGKPVCVGGNCDIDCDTGYEECDGACVAYESDPLNCGACGTKCDEPSNGTAVCESSQCGIVCDTGFAACGESCVNVQNDTSNCGGCGVVCPSGQYCVTGACSDTCPGEVCGGNCVDLATDPLNCASCGNACATPDFGSATCVGSTCDFSCNDGYDKCNGACVSFASDLSNCGGCGLGCPAPPPNATASCENGVCTNTCTGGLDLCGGVCVNLQTNGSNCGACGTACASGDVCSNGACVSSCPSGTTECSGDCVNTQADVSNCGSCDNACAVPPNSYATCSGGSCGSQCIPGWLDCNQTPAQPGCEVYAASDPLNCGACGNPCGAPTHGVPSCSGGSCGFTCQTGFSKCNGACVNYQNDPQNCGSCGNACTNGMVCTAGNCVANCVLPEVLCGNICVKTLSNVNNCGACGNICQSKPNANPTCTGGICGITCIGGFGNCNGSDGDGCEVNLNTSVAHCGACARDCKATNVMSKSCANGVCDSFCAGGFVNCNKPAAPGTDNGCEAAASDQSCSACTSSCGSLSCAVGPSSVCGCKLDDQCTSSPSALNNCDSGSAQCVCNGVTCYPGEVCSSGGATLDGGVGGDFLPQPPFTPEALNPTCSCNGGPTCPLIIAGNSTCCPVAGCVDTVSNPLHCGGCGHACPPGFECFGGLCKCNETTDCTVGGVGTCNLGNGLCICNGTTCSPGQRCQPGNVCG